MKARGIEVWSWDPNKNYISELAYELLKIINCFLELIKNKIKEKNLIEELSFNICLEKK